jgi:hypothetical protein
MANNEVGIALNTPHGTGFRFSAQPMSANNVTVKFSATVPEGNAREVLHNMADWAMDNCWQDVSMSPSVHVEQREQKNENENPRFQGNYEQLSEPEKQLVANAFWDSMKEEYRRGDLPIVTFSYDERKAAQEVQTIKTAIESNGSFKVPNSKGDGYYTVVFPSGAPAPNLAPLPVCSCKAYQYRNYGFCRGSCKHLRDVFEFVGYEFGDVAWDARLSNSNAWVYDNVGW